MFTRSTKTMASCAMAVSLLVLGNTSDLIAGPEGDIPVVPPPESPYEMPSLNVYDKMKSYVEFLKLKIDIKNHENKMAELENEGRQSVMKPVILSPGVQEKEKQEKTVVKEEASVPIFPMPGGNPQIRSIYGTGNRLEAELQIPQGGQIIVRTGDPLPLGYKVVRVGHGSVIIGKNGETSVLTFGAPSVRSLAPETASQPGA